MIRRGKVESIQREKVRVAFVGDACESCKTPCAACAKPKKQTVLVDNKLGASVGDTVEIDSPDGAVVWTAVFLFLVPLLVGIVLAAVLSGVMEEQKAVLIAALSALFLMILCAVVLSFPFFRRKTALTMRRIVAEEAGQKDLDKPETLVYNDKYAKKD